jgi:arylsulfatase
MIRLPEGSAPRTAGITHTVTAKVEIPAKGAEGVVICVGGDTSGWALSVEEGKLVYHYNWFDVERYRFVSTLPVPTGKAELKFDFLSEGPQPGAPATVTLSINGKPAGQGKIKRQVPQRFGVECLDVGMDTLSAVSKTYVDKLPYRFTGRIESVRLDLK